MSSAVNSQRGSTANAAAPRFSWRMLTTEAVVVAAIIAVAAFFRFYRFTDVPSGLVSDEAINLTYLLRVLKGEFFLIFNNDGREPLFHYLSLVPVALYSPQFWSIRIVSMIMGTTTVAFVYGFARYLFRSIPIAALAAFFAAISVWHVFWSRYGVRGVVSTFVILMASWWYWRALKTMGWRDYVIAGVCTGMALYTYLSARLLPVAIVLLTLCAMVLYRDRIATYIKGLTLTGGITAAIFMPLAVYFYQHLDDFLSHSANLSILDPRVNKGDLPLALWNNTVAVAGMFLIRGDHEAYRNIPNRPVFDPILGAFFVAGILVLVWTLLSRGSAPEDRLRAIFVGLWVVVFASSSVLSDDAPSSVRTLPSMPAVMMLPAWGLATVAGFLRGTWLKRIGALGVAMLLMLETGLSFRDYFVDYAPSGVAAYAFDNHIIDTGNWIKANAQTSEIYLAPLWAKQWTMQFVTRNVPLKSYDSRDTVVLPSRASGKDALVVFPQEQASKADKLGERLGGLGTREVVPGAFGVDYAVGYRVPAQNLPDSQNPLAVLDRAGEFLRPKSRSGAIWGDQFQLLAYTVSPEGPGGRNVTVTLFLRALKPAAADYTFSLKVSGDKGRVRGQEDKWPGDNSYATSQWSPGEIIIEKFYPGLAACAPSGNYDVTVEAYDPKTMQVLATSGGTSVSLGSFQAGPSEGNRPEDLEIDQTVDTDVAPQLRLLGITLDPSEVHPGENVSLSLFWRGIGTGAVAPAKIRLRDAAKRDWPIQETSIGLPPEGRGLCTLVEFQMPTDAAAGNGGIFVNDVKISSINVVR